MASSTGKTTVRCPGCRRLYRLPEAVARNFRRCRQCAHVRYGHGQEHR